MRESINITNIFSKSFLAALCITIPATVFAQYEIIKYSVNNGGGKMSGGNFEINTSIGQSDVNDNQSGGDFLLRSGFWHGNNDLIFKSGIE